MPPRFLGCPLGLAIGLVSGQILSMANDSPPDRISFEATVRPILKEHCWHCHGEEPKLEGGFDARLAKLLLRGGESGKGITPGNHVDSLVYQRMANQEMPPGEKKVPKDQLAKIAAWIDQGAITSRPEPESLPVGDVLLDADREHWSFRPIVRPELPDVVQRDRVRTPVDLFLIKELEKSGLGFGDDADRLTLVRRVSLDLLGLPPDSETIESVLFDPDDDWYEQMVERVLASPAYGERWGRHWLDISGYSDSNGYTEKDIERKWAWRYRDYVIRSLNQDKPWNEMIVEQLAGDELIRQPIDSLSEKDAERLIATGFLRMVPDGTADGSSDVKVASNEVVAETIKVVSSSLLGLTVGCAQCHSHRYDPISQTDYYRFRAILEPALNWKSWKSPEQRLISLWNKETREKAAAVDKEAKEISEQRNAELDKLVQETFDRELAKLPEEIQVKAREARETVEKERSPEQKELIKEYPFLNVNRGSVYLYLPDRLKGFNKKWDDAAEANKKKRPADDLVHCLMEPSVESNKPPETFVFYRGDFNSPRNAVEPGELSVLTQKENPIRSPQGDTKTSGRRLSYARHLTSGQHPLVTRVLVNRFWLHHFGKGLVATPTDFGLLGAKPSHPELLDWLADEFQRKDWSLKDFHRLILGSTAYRQSSVRRVGLDAIDPENRLLGRMPLRRLEAESIRDAILMVGGNLSRRQLGPPVAITPDEVGQIVVGVDTRDSAGRPSGKKVDIGEDEFRRSLYVQVRRSMPLSVLEPFDNPVMEPNCGLRATSTVAPQSLLMMNNEFVAEGAERLASRIEKSSEAKDWNQIIDRAWFFVFGRNPTRDERSKSLDYLASKDVAPIDPAESGSITSQAQSSNEEFIKKEAEEKEHQRLVQFCHALLCSNLFLYVE